MRTPIFVTGNKRKVDALRRWLGYDLPHEALDLDELQELDPMKVVEHKAHQAYKKLKKPVLIEDTSLEFTALGRLPGTFIKWFLQEMGMAECCALLDGMSSRAAVARVIYGVYDGKVFTTFSHEVKGIVPVTPRGEGGFGWDPIFVPEGSDKTYAEMTPLEFEQFSVRGVAAKKLGKYLDK